MTAYDVLGCAVAVVGAGGALAVSAPPGDLATPAVVDPTEVVASFDLANQLTAVDTVRDGVAVSPTPNGVRIDLGIINPKSPSPPFFAGPAIDVSLVAGSEVVSRPGSPSFGVDEFLERVAFVEVTGDGYPSIESYWDLQGRSVTAINSAQGSALAGVPVWLFPPLPNRNVRFEESIGSGG